VSTFRSVKTLGSGTVNAKGKFSGPFTGQTDSGVAISGTITKKSATLAGTVTGSRADLDHPPDLQRSGTIAAEAQQSK
jgi:hypothetical protein